MKNLIEHAKRELALVDLGNSDPKYKETLIASVMPLIAVFSVLHSATSPARLIAETFGALAKGDVLSPITDYPEEWERIENTRGPLWKNIRKPSIFSRDGGRTYYDKYEPKDAYGQHTIHNSKAFRIQSECEKIQAMGATLRSSDDENAGKGDEK